MKTDTSGIGHSDPAVDARGFKLFVFFFGRDQGGTIYDDQVNEFELPPKGLCLIEVEGDLLGLQNGDGISLIGIELDIGGDQPTPEVEAQGGKVKMKPSSVKFEHCEKVFG